MAWNTIIKRATVHYPHFEMTGPIVHEPGLAALVHLDESAGDEEVLSTDLSAYGFVCAPEEVFVKNWSEHQGFAAALHAADVVEIVGEVNVGPFVSQAYRVRVSSDLTK